MFPFRAEHAGCARRVDSLPGRRVRPPANALGLSLSQARKVQVCGWEPVGRVWSAGITAQFGTRELGLGAITQIWVQ